ncbi:pyridoxal phosphate-dependent decarboxylase family protein [Kribbella flavida]|nr:aminotransferase class V-fold PLP-dependent enzyme [Kribbella flavida]
MYDDKAPLALSGEQMRRLGYAATDFLADRIERLGDQPVTAEWSRADLEDKLREAIPTAGTDPEKVLERVVSDVLSACAATDHPRFFSFVPSPGNYVAAVADFLASGANVFAGNWVGGAGAAQVELVVIEWLRELFGLPAAAGGILTTGGTQASLLALHAARTKRFGGVAPQARIYVTHQTHAAVVRGFSYLGFGADQIRRVRCAPDLTMDADALRQAIIADRAAGTAPFFAVATAGTTNTGAIDPLAAIADVCSEQDVWFHVDAAYGGAAILTDQGRQLLRGLERADSIAVDPHKWWFQPYEAGCVLVRDVDVLSDAFALHAEYLTENRAATRPVNFYDYGPQLTRSFRALKLWMTLQTFGLDAVRAGVAHGMDMAEYAESLLLRTPYWQIVSPAQLSVLTFRPHHPGLDAATLDEVTRRIAAAMMKQGFALVLTTDLGDGPVLRFCSTHPQTTRADVETTVELLTRFLRETVDKLAV